MGKTGRRHLQHGDEAVRIAKLRMQVQPQRLAAGSGRRPDNGMADASHVPRCCLFCFFPSGGAKSVGLTYLLMAYLLGTMLIDCHSLF